MAYQSTKHIGKVTIQAVIFVIWRGVDDAKLIFVIHAILYCSWTKAVMVTLPCRYHRDERNITMVSVRVESTIFCPSFSWYKVSYWKTMTLSLVQSYLGQSKHGLVPDRMVRA